ncbi:MAG: type VI secretion system protein TssA [Gammaproteobacteria bacterium]
MDSLLQPISEDNPAGVDLRADVSPTSTYNVLKDARNSARAAERKNVFDSADNTALNHWKTVQEMAPSVSVNETKDLEITSWYIEALTRTEGFDGLLRGFRVLKGLITQYWDEVYPLPDEEGLETKVASITGLNGLGAEGVLIAPIRNIPITRSGNVDFSLWQYKQAVEIQKIPDERVREERTGAAGFSMDDVQHAVNETVDADIVMLKSTIGACLDEYRQISQLLDDHCGEHSPPTSNIVNVLEDCQAAVNHLYKDRNIDVANDTEDDQPDQATNSENGGGSGSSTSRVGSPIKSREDAFQQILEISAYFRKTEPHSPVSYVLEKAVKWGRMPLDQLIPELIADGGALEQYRNLTGITSSEE